MQISSRFSIALHIFACVDAFQATHKMTSDSLSQLRRAGLIRIARGTGGITLERALKDISFYDVYAAIEPVERGALFRFHENPNPNCPVGKNIHKILDNKFTDIQSAMEAEMRKYTLEDIHRDLLRLDAVQGSCETA